MKVPSSVEENQVDRDILEMYSANVMTIQNFIEDNYLVKWSHISSRRSALRHMCLSSDQLSDTACSSFLPLHGALLPRFFTLANVP